MKSTLKANFQRRVGDWINACFGKAIGGDHVERNHRFLEEALELVQACGCTEIEARQLVSYVFSRPVGEKKQEIGGVMTTLAALCNMQDLDMFKCGEEELTRIWTKVEKIREKQASKPKFSPLPVHASSALPYEIAKRIVGTSDNKSLQACILDPMILQIADAIEDAERRRHDHAVVTALRETRALVDACRVTGFAWGDKLESLCNNNAKIDAALKLAEG